jgi:hypothetical protein
LPHFTPLFYLIVDNFQYLAEKRHKKSPGFQGIRGLLQWFGRSLRGFAALCGFLQVFTAFCGFLRFYAALCCFMRLFAGFYCFLRVFACFCGFMLLFAAFCGFLPVFAAFCGFLPVFAGFCGFMRLLAGVLKGFRGGFKGIYYGKSYASFSEQHVSRQEKVPYLQKPNRTTALPWISDCRLVERDDPL